MHRKHPPWTVRPRRRVRLTDIDTASTRPFRLTKRRAELELEHSREELDQLQERLFADGRHAVLVILQGMDTAGKDAVIRHVFSGVNPQGVRAVAFKAPTPVEMGHDFLWRIHPHTPGKGEMAIFNRSHYEDVLVARVHHLVPAAEWAARYRAINGFERMLTSEGTTVLKFFLHISRKEQARRLRARLTDPSKQWKLSPADLTDRRLWAEYVRAYEEVIERTTSRRAPWFIVPSDHAWFRNWAVSRVLLETLRGLRLRYPKPSMDLSKYRID